MNGTIDQQIAFVHMYCTHYSKRTFELLSNEYKIKFIFYSEGREHFWQLKHGIHGGYFDYQYLPGFRVGNTRITPTLPLLLLKNNYQLYISGINGRFALPVVYLMSRVKRKPFILWTGIWNRINTRFHRWFFPVIAYMYKHSDAVIVYGEHVKKYLISEGVSEEKIFVTHHSVDNSYYSLHVPNEIKLKTKEELDILPQQKVILYLGRLEEVKGLEYLIGAFAQMQRENTVLVFAGEGNKRSELERIVNEKMIGDSVRFAGYVPIEDTRRYYSIADIFVLPSITTDTIKETWGLVINEALNQGVPVIASDAVGASAGGLVRNGYNGFVVPERNAEALREALEMLLIDDEFLNQMSKNACESIKDWTQEQMAADFKTAIDFVLARKK